MNSLLQDLRYGARMLLKKPSFTLIAALTLALGIGATTALFSVVDGVLLRPLPYRDEARIVTLWQSNMKSGVEREETSPANFLDWRERLQSCEAIAAIEPFGHSLIGNGEPERFRSWVVTENFFEILGAAPLYGRTFLPEEFGASRGNVVVLGYGLWQHRFGGDPQLVGRQLTLNGQPHTVVGVMPPEWQSRCDLLAIPPILCTAFSKPVKRAIFGLHRVVTERRSKLKRNSNSSPICIGAASRLCGPLLLYRGD